MKTDKLFKDARWRLWLSGKLGTVVVEAWAQLHERAFALKPLDSRPARDLKDYERRRVACGRLIALGELIDALGCFVQSLLSRCSADAVVSRRG